MIFNFLFISSVSIGNRLRHGRPINGERFFRDGVQIDSGAHPASYSMVTGGSFLESKVAGE